MKTECLRIADEIRSTMEGKAWYGDPVKKILEGITAEQAVKHPIASAHSMWELVLHMTAWVQAALGAINGSPMPKYPWTPEFDFPPITDSTDVAWQTAVRGLFEKYAELASKIEAFVDERLDEAVPGRSYNYYHLFLGMAQHAVYHTGQIALLKKS